MNVWVTLNDRTYKVLLSPSTAPQVDGVSIPADIRLLQPGVLSILLTLPDGTTRSFRCIADANSETAAVLIDGVRIAYTLYDPRSLRSAFSANDASGPRALKSPMPGRIVRVLVAEGDLVEQGQGCIVIEAMKMQNELKAPKSGTITQLTASAGETVTADTILLTVD